MNKLAYLLLLTLVAAHGSGPRATSHIDSSAAWATVPRRDAVSLRPVHWTVVGGSGARELVLGRTVPITVQADIARGWHIYSLTQKSGGPIPLRIDLLLPTEIVVRGLIKAPKPERAFDKNFGIETELYSGSPRFIVPIGVAGKSVTGVRKFQIGARYQVCSDKVCLPPRTDTLAAAIRIAGRK